MTVCRKKVVFEVTAHMRGCAGSQLVGGIPGAAMAAKHVNDYWMYVEYRNGEGKPEQRLFEVEKDSSQAVIDKAMALENRRCAMRTERSVRIGSEK
jgi:hypothetical protein